MPAGEQHVPVGCGQGFGSHSPDLVHTAGAAQAACVTSAQPPLEEQQDPVGWEQGFGEQDPTPLVQMLGVAHPAWIVRVQVPAGAQQDPVGCGHGFGLHAPDAVQTAGASHADSLVTVHTPLSAQQAPAGREHGLGEQSDPAPAQAFGAAQAASVVTVQAPSAAQQAPVAVTNPMPVQVTVPFPVVIPQVLVPAVAGWKRTEALMARPALREYGPPPVTTENSGHGEPMVPLSVSPPVLVKVKVRSTECPTSTLPKSRLASSSFGIGGCVPSSPPHPPEMATATIKTASQAGRLKRILSFAFMSNPRDENTRSEPTAPKI